VADGFVKVIFDAESDELLGAHMVGADVTEQLQGFGIAHTLEATAHDLVHTVFAHPTVSEAMHEAVLDAAGIALHA
jgi:dihydrolipoamide dehydrogenase